ncbi:MAG: hypothetical protein WEB58_19015 [Planctomycetaceae bacterium]
MRWANLLIAAILIASGCADEPQFSSDIDDLPVAEAPTLDAVIGQIERETASETEAMRVIDEAIEAMGGLDAFQHTQQGYVKWQTIGKQPGISKVHSSETVTAEVYFDLPDFHRREMYADPTKEHGLIITNAETTWVGTNAGQGRRVPTSPLEMFHAPFTAAVMESLTKLKEVPTHLFLVESPPDDDFLVVEAYDGDEFLSECVFDKKSHLLIEIFKLAPEMRTDRPLEMVETVTSFSEYKQFGPVTLPTVVCVTQTDNPSLTMKLLVADFDSPVDRKLFELPD